jgi:hypothetical protein
MSMLIKFKFSNFIIIVTLALGTYSPAWARGHWAEHHPRRAQVNHRLLLENHRINQKFREGEISRRQAAMLHQQGRQIRHQERTMARQHGGHITRQERWHLNQQENALSRQIGR